MKELIKNHGFIYYGVPQTHKDLPASVSGMLGLKLGTTTPVLKIIFFKDSKQAGEKAQW